MRWNSKQRVICLAVVMSLVWSGAAFYGAQDTTTKQKTETKKPKKTEPDVIFVPTPQPVVEAMLKLAKLKKGEMVYDLGCGDGRIVVTAAKMGAKGKGFDVDPRRIKESMENVKKNKVEKDVQIIQEDIFTLDLKEADVITLYLLPRLNVKLIPQLDKLRKGVRIVSHSFNMEGVEPDKEETVDVDGSGHTIYLWTTPLKKTGDASKKTS